MDAPQEALLLKSQRGALRLKDLHARKIPALGRAPGVHAPGDGGDSETAFAKAEIQKGLKEKGHPPADLNSMAKSFSDLFTRLEKQVGDDEGARRNENH